MNMTFRAPEWLTLIEFAFGLILPILQFVTLSIQSALDAF